MPAYSTAAPAAIQNQGGLVASQGLLRTAQIVNTILAAGQTLPLSQAGQGFYLIASNGAVSIRPSNGTFNSYYVGTGAKTDALNSFSMLELRNDNTFSVTLSLWVGFGDYIDNRNVQITDLFYPVVFPTYPVATAATNLLIPDLSGSAIVDINGQTWLALNRLTLQITNFDTVNAMPLKDTTNKVGAILACLPNTSLIIAISGNYRITLGTTALNCLVSETYNCIRPTLAP